MSTEDELEIFLVTLPGHEQPVADEARGSGFKVTSVISGGVTVRGDWSEVWRANLCLRGPSRVLARLGEFRAFHLAQLDKRSRKFPWTKTLRSDVPLKVDTTCRRSKIYHAKAATQRVEKALTEAADIRVSSDASLVLKVRIEDDLVTFSVDSSGEGLHKRGHKQGVGKAPLRETMAAMFLRQMGYDGRQAVIDPMCGSGTICIEAAEIALGLPPGRSRHFAFENLASFDPAIWNSMRPVGAMPEITQRLFASDRDEGAVRMATNNAERAGVAELISFQQHGVSELQRPDVPPGIVLVNPPYGARIGNRKVLFSLYGALGKTLAERFVGWRVGVITSDGGLAKSTGLGLKPAGPPVAHGGLKVSLFQGQC
jgi:putative N6-adenine-specific DNA methylase